MTGTTLNIPTVGLVKNIPLKLTEVIKPGMTRRIRGEGLPYSKQPTKRGDLIIEFDIIFPDTLSDSIKSKLKDILPSTTLSR